MTKKKNIQGVAHINGASCPIDPWYKDVLMGHPAPLTPGKECIIISHISYEIL